MKIVLLKGGFMKTFWDYFIYKIYTGVQSAQIGRKPSGIERTAFCGSILMSGSFSDSIWAKSQRNLKISHPKNYDFPLYFPMVPLGNIKGNRSFLDRKFSNASNFLLRWSQKKIRTSISIRKKQFFRFLMVSERFEHSRSPYISYII